MTTMDIIEPIIYATYGKTLTAEAMAGCLARKIDNYADESHDDRDSRERMVMLTCWDWMTGGSTAEAVARKIEAALVDMESKSEGDQE